MSNKYFKNVAELIEYALGDIENFGNFEFQYTKADKEVYKIVKDYDSIKEIDNNNFEFNRETYNIDFVVPCC